MPELPEVERVRRTLLQHVRGQTVQTVRVSRPEVVRGSDAPPALLQGLTLGRIDRHGKQLALIGQTPGSSPGSSSRRGSAVGDEAAAVCVHLGMTGSLRFFNAGPDNPLPSSEAMRRTHTHVVWQLAGGGYVAFRDPRRFGGLWTFPSQAALIRQRWSALGEDALAIPTARLADVLARTPRSQRPLKAALLDQQVVAGLGNIYVDELLFRCRLHPLTPASQVDRPTVRRMVRAMRALLRQAIDQGGSTLRDYVDGNGSAGGFQQLHRVYGRAGEACVVCRATLVSGQVAGRTTVWCPACQAMPAGLSSF